MYDATTGLNTIVFGDLHVYESHVDAVRQQLQRVPKRLPTIHISRLRDGLWNVQTEDIRLDDYHPEPTIRAEMVV